MLMIELDNKTELALIELAQLQGKTTEQWVKDIILQWVNLNMRPQILPDLSEFRDQFIMQNQSAGDFCQTLRDQERF